MYGMFAGAASFDGDLSSWDVSSVATMTSMFDGATSFNGDISSWDVSSAIDMDRMFGGATSFNGDLSSWDVSSVITMDRMFDGATSFDGDISSWDVSSVITMDRMFEGATSFNGDLSSWDVSSVTNMNSMFRDATSFDIQLCFLASMSGVNTDGMFDNSGGGSVRSDCAQCVGGEFRVDPNTCDTCPANTFAPEPCDDCSGAVSCSSCDSGMTSAPGAVICDLDPHHAFDFRGCSDSSPTADTGVDGAGISATAVNGATCSNEGIVLDGVNDYLDMTPWELGGEPGGVDSRRCRRRFEGFPTYPAQS